MIKSVVTSVLLLIFSLPAWAGELTVHKGNPNPPPLKLKDINGKMRDLKEFRGKVVLVNFWASWCPPCRAEMPSMYRLQQKLKGKPFVIVAVNMDETRVEVDAFLPPQLKKAFVVLMDVGGKALKTWKVYAFPTSYVIDTRGKIRLALYGEAEWDDDKIVKRIQALMPKKK